MLVADGTRSKSNVMETDDTGSVLQDNLKKLESLDTRMTSMKSRSQGRDNREFSVNDVRNEAEDKYERRMDYYPERQTRQTKVDFPTFDGSRVQDWVFKSERFFELDATPATLKEVVWAGELGGICRCHDDEVWS